MKNDLPPIHHVMIAIPPGGEDAARTFYVETLGLLEIAKPASLKARGGLWVATGSLDLHIGIERSFIPARKAHIALLVHDLELVRTRLSAAGYDRGTIERELPGFRRCYVNDPFGNRVELLQSD